VHHVVLDIDHQQCCSLEIEAAPGHGRSVSLLILSRGHDTPALTRRSLPSINWQAQCQMPR
jgi:hypothetical protein